MLKRAAWGDPGSTLSGSGQAQETTHGSTCWKCTGKSIKTGSRLTGAQDWGNGRGTANGSGVSFGDAESDYDDSKYTKSHCPVHLNRRIV